MALPMDDEGLDPDALAARARRGRDELPLHDPDLPEPERPHALDRASPARRRARGGARSSRAGGRPVRARPVRGRVAAVALRPGGRHARHLRLLLLEDRRAGPARRLVRRSCGACRPDRSARGVHLHLAAVPDAGDGARADRPRRVRAEPRADPRPAEGTPRRDARVRSSASSAVAATWSKPEGGYFLWVDLPASGGAALSAPRPPASPSSRARTSSPTARGEQSARLAFSYASPSEIDSGVSTLASLLRV